VRPQRDRLRFLVRVSVATALATAVLVAVSQPYLERRRDGEHVVALRREASAVRPGGVAAPSAEPAPVARPAERPPAPRADGQRPEDAVARPLVPLYVRLFWPPGIDVSLVLALAGLAALSGGVAVSRRLAATGLTFALLGTGLLLVLVSGMTPRLPTFLAFFRNGFRLTAITGFGVALLATAALERSRAALGARAGAVIAVAVAVVVLATRGRDLVSPTLDPVAPVSSQAAAYRRLAEIAREQGSGPLLELPASGPRRDAIFTDAMVASTVHHLPLVTGFGPAFPLHWPLVAAAIDRLPAEEALQELVDMTGVRWVLLRPDDDWPSPEARAAMADGLAPFAGNRAAVDGFLLMRIDLPARQPRFAAALRRGYRPGESLLGTPYAPLPSGSAGAIGAPPAATASAGGFVWLPIEIANRGPGDWPGALTKNGGTRGEVFVAARWRRPSPIDAGSPALLGSDVGLRRDLPAGDSLQQTIVVAAPRDPGDYRLELRLEQRGSDALRSAPAAVVAVRVEPTA
jgi:hypothetical protein